MEDELMPRGEPALGMYACDRDAFARIWKRVRPEEAPDSPITPLKPETQPCTPPVDTPVPEPPVPSTPPVSPEPPVPPSKPETGPCVPPVDVPAPEPPAPPPSNGSCTASAGEEAPPTTSVPPESQTPGGDDFPRPEAVPCLGSGSAEHGGQLQEDILTALEGWQLYRHLARKVTGNPARTLAALASEKHRQARKLAAAYFLISGVRYWPTDQLPVPRTNSWLGTLRRRFALEQQLDSRWRGASLDTQDACLADLYGELAEDCAAHAGVLRALLEQAL